MSKKITNLNSERRKRKSRSMESTAEAAARLFLDKIPNDLEEPEAFASGGDMAEILKEENEDE